jgi:N-acetylneuraminic acid mutarotase
MRRTTIFAIALLLLAAAAGLTSSGTLLALSQHAVAGRAQRTLTLQERVSHQRAIEEVYWRHRIWPKENANPKPSLDAVMSQAQLEKKVTDYLRNSQALEDYWQRPITSQQLQAEMDRMATHTKQSEVLQELFEALGNDPFVIAECLARPALADRLITNWYGYDQRIHGELKRRAETELQTRASLQQMKQLSGKYSETEFVRSDGAGNGTNRNAEHSVKLNSREWDETMHKLAASFESRRHAAGFQSADMSAHSISAANDAYEAVPVGNVGPLQEDEERYYATAVIEKSNDAVNLATVSWRKEQLEAWLARAGNQADTAMTEPSGNYTLPEILDGAGCIGDTWTATAGPPDGRDGHTAVWTGNEMIIWGGTGSGLNTGARYNPSTDSWTATSTTNAPTARLRHTAVWTGSEMIIWGGDSYDGAQRLYWNTGGRYNPSTNSWTATGATNAPSARSGHSAVWTGSEMIVWGGSNATTVFNTGGRYNRSTNSWTATATVNAPTARYGASTVWTGSEMIVWGGYNSGTYFNTGGRYNPSTNSWMATTATNAPSARSDQSAVWTGSEMILWGGYNGNNNVNTGGRYNPATNSWATTSTINAPSGRSGHTAVWTGSQMIIWGGIGGGQLLGNGGRYNPGTNSWMVTTTNNAPSARFGHTVIWTGNEMIVWGGVDFGSVTNTGGRYNPSTNSWTATSTTNAPERRSSHTAVWTGSEMIVWGGVGVDYFNTGGRYTPSTDSWVATSTSGAPGERAVHTAVWTGSEMIVWGGEWYNGAYHVWNTGGRYNPGTDSWTASSIANAPAARELHGAVWTGSEMIVWGGTDENLNPFNTGGRYNPSTNTWTPTTTANAPSSRRVPGAIWTGSEMIVWGGYGTSFTGYFNTGGRYNPVTDVWTATSTSNAPAARSAYRAVWTGNEMIIWGGYFTDINGVHDLNTGGRYNPNTNSWAPTSTTNVPEARSAHAAVWTGNEMIVWGGIGVHSTFFNSGGRYSPSTDGWITTSTIDAPETRYGHTAVWTGNEMIVWGGFGSSVYLNSGGRYCAPTPCTGRCSPTPRPRPTPYPRPMPP